MERLSTKIKKDKVLISLIDHRGNITAAVEGAYVGKTQFYYWLKNDEEFRKNYEAILNKIVSYCKNKRLQQLFAENPDALEKHVKFLNKKLKKT